jgi:hypothetical protein
MYTSPETKAIRQRMEEVRCDLDEDVQTIVQGARDMVDWRSYVKTYPWVCLGAALALGYLIVPRRPLMQREIQTLAELAEPAEQSRLVAMSQLSTKGNVRGMLLALVGNLAVRGISSFVEQQFDKHFASQTVNSHHEDQI